MIENIHDRKYYIVFSKHTWGKPNFIWSLIFYLFNRKHLKYSHVFAYTGEDDHYTVIAGAPWQLGIHVSSGNIEDILGFAKKGGCTSCIEISSRTHKDSYSPRGIITCVSIVKALLGIRGFFIITPNQLRKKLLSLGGKELWAQQQSP